MAIVETLIERSRSRRDLPRPAMRRALREEARLSLAEVAAAIGVSVAAVSRWETGQREPRQPWQDRYAALLEQLREEVATVETERP